MHSLNNPTSESQNIHHLSHKYFNASFTLTVIKWSEHRRGNLIYLFLVQDNEGQYSYPL